MSLETLWSRRPNLKIRTDTLTPSSEGSEHSHIATAGGLTPSYSRNTQQIGSLSSYRSGFPNQEPPTLSEIHKWIDNMLSPHELGRATRESMQNSLNFELRRGLEHEFRVHDLEERQTDHETRISEMERELGAMVEKLENLVAELLKGQEEDAMTSSAAKKKGIRKWLSKRLESHPVPDLGLQYYS